MPMQFSRSTVTRLDQATAAVLYVGYATPGVAASDPSWKIIRLTEVGTETLIEYAGGNSAFNSVWADRASLSYS